MLAFREVKSKDGRLIVAKGLYSHFEVLKWAATLDFKQEKIRSFDQEVGVPCLVDYQGELGYSYSKTYHPAKLFNQEVKRLIDEMGEYVNFRFNSVLFNYYKDGQDYMGYHQDNESEIDTTYIASLSIGVSRRFNFKHCDGELFSVMLDHGDVLIMENFQNSWKHAISKTKVTQAPSLNMTFRKILREPL